MRLARFYLVNNKERYDEYAGISRHPTTWKCGRGTRVN